MNEDMQLDVSSKMSLKTWKQIFKIMIKSKKHLIRLMLFGVGTALLELAFPLINRYAIDHFFKNNDMTYLPHFIVINVVVAISFGLCIWGFIYEGGIIESETSYQLRKEAFEKIQTLPFAYFDKTPQGWIMARLTSDAKRLSNIISWGLVNLVWAVISIVFTIIVLLMNHFLLALIVLVSVPFMIIIGNFFRKKILKYHRKARQYNSEMTASYSEAFLGAKTTKSLAIEDERLEDFKVKSSKMRQSGVRAVRFSALFSSIILAISYIVTAIIIFFGSYFHLNDIHILGVAMGFGTLQMFISYTVGFFDPIMVLTSFLSEFQNAQASAERIVALITTESTLIDSKEVIEKYGDMLSDKTMNWEPLKGDVQFKDVSFYYLENEMILERFNLEVKQGQMVAFIGHTGSGKTTIVNLLARFYEPITGEILIDGIDYRQRSIHWLHQQIGYVLQSPHLFSDTIYENIRYGNLNATEQMIIDAAKSVGAHDFISQLKDGYQTEVGEGGDQLSIGQKQLISFARAIISDPKILILDEATASIDSESEALIQEATKILLDNRTSFVVAHRLSTIVDADLIVVMEMGKIIEMGTHQSLLQQKGHYFELYRQQFIDEQEKKFEIK